MPPIEGSFHVYVQLLTALSQGLTPIRHFDCELPHLVSVVNSGKRCLSQVIEGLEARQAFVSGATAILSVPLDHRTLTFRATGSARRYRRRLRSWFREVGTADIFKALFHRIQF